MFSNLPKIVAQSIFFIKAIGTSRSFLLIQRIVYLWREFYIKTRLIPVIKEVKVEFKYKDEMLTSCKIEKLEDLIKIIDRIAATNAEKGKDIE